MMNCAGTVTINRNAIGIICIIAIFLLAYYGFGASNDKDYKSQISEYVDLKSLLSASIDAAKKGGRKVAEVRESASLKEKSKGKTHEGANDPVTDGDMLSHVQMFNSLKKAFPKVTIISEEKVSHHFNEDSVEAANLNEKDIESLHIPSKYVNAKDVQIWIDPLDATQEYTEDLRQYVTTMVCVAFKGVPIIGVIHKPFENYTAWAYVNNYHSPLLKVEKTKKVSTVDSIARIIVSRSHKGSVVQVAQEAFGEKAVITDAGGAGYKTLEVLSGRQDVYVHKTLIKKWDICAGNAILNHFGGKMTTLHGALIDYSSPSQDKNPDGIIAALENHDYYVNKLQKL